MTVCVCEELKAEMWYVTVISASLITCGAAVQEQLTHFCSQS